MEKSIIIYGAGAIGGFYGSVLAKAGARVSVACRSDYDAVQKQGIIIKSDSLKDLSFNPEQVYHTDNLPSAEPDYLVISTKAMLVPKLPEKIKTLVGPSTVIVIIQNGINIEEPFSKTFPGNEIISCLAFICVTRTGPGIVHHQDYGRITLGSYPGGTSKAAETLLDLFTRGGIQASLSETITTDRWIKLVWNAPFNPLSAITGGANTQEMLASEERYALISTVMKEVQAIAAADGNPFPDEIITKNLADTRKMTPYVPSMGIDSIMKRPMEVEAILGEPLKVARNHGVDAPAMTMLYGILSLLDKKRPV